MPAKVSMTRALQQDTVPVAVRKEQKEKILLIINSKTTTEEIKEAVSLARGRDAALTVIYTAVPLFVSDQTTSWEVDSDFLDRLQKGKAVLDSIAYEARNQGAEVSTSFVWAESPKDVAAEYGNTVSSIVDKTA
jgi:hypothetical protein